MTIFMEFCPPHFPTFRKSYRVFLPSFSTSCYFLKLQLKFSSKQKHAPPYTHTTQTKRRNRRAPNFAGTTVGLKYNTYTTCNTGYIILINNKNINALFLIAYWLLFSNYALFRSLYYPWSHCSYHFIIRRLILLLLHL